MIPPKISHKYLTRFDELISQGEAIKKTIKIEPGGYQNNWVRPTERAIKNPDKRSMDYDAFRKWEINCYSLLDKVISAHSIHRKIIDGTKEYYSQEHKLESLISVLKGLKEDYEQGFMEDLAIQIEAEIAADYMGQAEKLLAEGLSGKYDHVPAAVLAGAVLEKALKTICTNQTPPIPTVKAKGSPLTLNLLIEELKKVAVFNELKAKQLRAWADIRNAAAHGEFGNFNRSDVEGMIKGISEFLATYMN